jgi:hypothetical protein
MTSLYTQILTEIEALPEDAEITTNLFLPMTDHRASINKVLWRMEEQGIIECVNATDTPRVFRRRVAGRYTGFVPEAITEGVFAHLWARPAPAVGGRVYRKLVEEMV